LPKTPRPPGLPDFDAPPIAEVLLDAALDPLPLVRNAHIGLFWAEHLRSRYPVVQEQPPLDLTEEAFDVEQRVLEIRFDQPAPVMRQWFISPDDSRVIQLQQDRFIQNWRRPSPQAEYPRYESLRESFERDFETYSNFLMANDLGSPTIRQAEVTYINHLQPNEVWQTPNQLGHVLRSWKADFGDEGLLSDPVEDVRLAWRHLVADDRGPFARLYILVEPVPGGLTLRLTFRGKPVTSSLKSALEFFDMGRKRIVKAFTAVSTDAMHQLWRRRA
jgi:hypothetical protein